MTTICLCMIVKNESKIIERCLQRVIPYIDTWCISDTGSTDNTPELIINTLSSIKGTLLKRPWLNFGYNRTEVLEHIQSYGLADYSLVIDADDIISFNDFDKQSLHLDGYHLKVHINSTSFYSTRLFNNKHKWIYEGVLHEYPFCPTAKKLGNLNSISIESKPDGARSENPHKYLHDAQVLEETLKNDCGHLTPRYTFYLAQSYRDAGLAEKAIEWYKKRSALGNWYEEVWESLYQIGLLTEKLKLNHNDIIGAYLSAYQYRPQRAESLYQLARYCRYTKNWNLSYIYSSIAKNISLPNDVLFIDKTVYDWKCLDEYAVACTWTNRYKEAIKTNELLLKRKNLIPLNDFDRIQKNYNFCLSKVK